MAQSTNFTKEQTAHGYVLSNGTLKIQIPVIEQKRIDDLTDWLADEIRTNPKPPSMTIEEWQTELRRLTDLVDRIISDFPDKLNIFDYLPLTKNGKFPGNKVILIADSKCSTSVIWTSGNKNRMGKSNIQLRLISTYDTISDFLSDMPQNDTKVLEFGWSDSVNKMPPVFDFNGVPTKPVTVRPSYLKHTDVKTGFLYEEESGRQFLCLDEQIIGYRNYWRNNGQSGILTDFIYHNATGDYNHMYLRWSEKLEEQLTQVAAGNKITCNTLVHALCAEKRDWLLTSDKTSTRKTPRKFVKEIRQIFDPADTTPEVIQLQTGADTYCDYTLFKNNRKDTEIWCYISS